MQALAESGPWHAPVDEAQIPVFVEFGIDRHNHGSESEEDRISLLRDWVGEVSNSTPGTSVFMDNTTLYSGFSLVGGSGRTRSLSANTLLDLDTFVRCAILFDHISHLEAAGSLRGEAHYFDSRILNEELGNEPVIIPIPVDPGSYNEGVSAVLSDLFDEVEATAAAFSRQAGSTAIVAERETILHSWELLLGRSLTLADLDDVESRDRNWASSGPALLNSLLNWLGDDEDAVFSGMEDVSDFISEANCRSLFNTRVAGMLDLPYAPNTTRIPYRSHLFSTAMIAHDALQDVREIEETFRDLAANYLTPGSIELPFFLSAVLARTKSLDDFFTNVAELRSQAAPYRRHRAELLDALSARRTKDIDKLRAAVRDDGSKLTGAVASGSAAVVMGSVAALGHGLAPWIIGGLKAALGLDQEKRRLIGRRLFRPEFWFVTSTATSARALIDSWPAIDRLWDEDEVYLSHIQNRLVDISALDQTWL
jgi:hypothetical protein